MRRVVFLALVAVLALPMAAWADYIKIENLNGAVLIGLGGLEVNGGSHLHSFSAGSFSMTAGPGQALGQVSFGTGAFQGTNYEQSGTFSASGSYFTVWGVGAWMRGLPGVPKYHGRLTLFQGAFTGPIQWIYLGKSGVNQDYELKGDIAGTLWNGHQAYGYTTQTFYETQRWWNAGRGCIRLGDSTLKSTPEPGTLSLLGSGLVGVAGLFRRKKSA